MLSSLPRTLRTAGTALAGWPPPRRGAALGGAAVTALLVGQPTEVFVEAIEAAKKAAEEHGR